MSGTEFLEKYYGNYDEDGRLRSRHGMVEFLTTMRYIEKYLRPGMRILEIGAGTGRYSHALAQMGYAQQIAPNLFMKRGKHAAVAAVPLAAIGLVTDYRLGLIPACITGFVFMILAFAETEKMIKDRFGV